MNELDRELEKVRAKQRAAMGAKASEGATRQGVLEEGIRAGLDHAMATMDPDLRNLESALDDKLDGGAFLMGMMGAAFAIQGIDLVEAAKLPWARKLFAEYIAKARRR